MAGSQAMAGGGGGGNYTKVTLLYSDRNSSKLSYFLIYK